MKKEKKLFILAIVSLIIISAIIIINSLNKTTPGQLLKINYTEVENKIKNKDSFVLVVSQSTCSHCATYKPKIEIIAKEYKFDMYYIDIDLEDKKEEFLSEFNLSGATPTTLFFKDGKEKSMLNRLEGDLSSKVVIKKLKELGFIEE